MQCPGIAEELVTDALMQCQDRPAMAQAAGTIVGIIRKAQADVVRLGTDVSNLHGCHDDDCSVREFLIASQRRQTASILGVIGAQQQPYDPADVR